MRPGSIRNIPRAKNLDWNPMLQRIPRALWLAAFLVCLAGVLTLSLAKNPSSYFNTGWDKTNHVLAFTVLTFLGRMSFPAHRLLLLLGLLAYGVLIENLQLLTGYRFGEYQDLAADVVGMLLGYGLAIPALRSASDTPRVLRGNLTSGRSE